MNIAGIVHESLIDGDGVRLVIFISGCKHNCVGCHNAKLSSFEYGKKFDKETENYIIQYIKNDPLIDGITLSGGDPIYSSDELTFFLHKVKNELPQKTIWLYTGFQFEEIQNLKIMDYVDVVVDGDFKQEDFDSNLRFKGSKNQRIIDVKKTKLNKKIELWEK